MIGYIKKIKSFIPEFIWEYFRLCTILKSHAVVATYWDGVLEKYVNGDIEKYSLHAKNKIDNSERIIWQYWGQGFSNNDVPEMVQICFDSVDKYKGDYTVIRLCDDDLKEYGITTVFAHNAGFDVKALNNTIRYISDSKFRFFFPRSVEIWDTLKMSRQVIGKQKSYIRFCNEKGYMTKHKVPQCRLTAEILYRYISGIEKFDESHTGLEDVLIETVIFAHCLRQHKKMEKRLYPPRE